MNFKSVLDKVFVSKELATVLLILHLTTFMAFTDYWWLKWVVTTHVRCNELANIYTHLNSPIFTQWFSFSSISCHIFCTTSCTTPVCGYIYERHPQMGARCSPNSLSPLDLPLYMVLWALLSPPFSKLWVKFMLTILEKHIHNRVMADDSFETVDNKGLSQLQQQRAKINLGF